MSVQPATMNEDAPVKVYWQPGCSSCLRAKEFLMEHGVPFVSVNVLEDENGFKELAELGLRLVPIVAKGKDWANGAVFRDVARVAGFAYGAHRMLSPAELKDRIDLILNAALRYTAQLPEESIDTLLPGRPRSYRQLAYHVFNIPEVFLNRVERDEAYTYQSLLSILPAEMKTKADLLAFGQSIVARLDAWWQGGGKDTDFRQPGKVYYGEVTLHEVLERTAWHSGQHTRQLMLTLKDKLGIAPDRPLADADLAGLPLPKEIWDNEKAFG